MKTNRKTTLLLIAIVALAAQAFGDAVFTLGNHPQPGEQNILFTSDQTGSTVFGFTNQSNTQVQFSSTTDTLVVTSAGQAKVSATDGLVNDITFTVPGHTFLNFILNPFDPANNNDLITDERRLYVQFRAVWQYPRQQLPYHHYNQQ